MTAITRSLLVPILKLWLRSQLETCAQLEVKISGSDRQLWQGLIPWAEVGGGRVVYQGLHLTEVKLVAREIKLNIPELLKGESLRLLAAIAVELELCLSAADLDACLGSPLLKNQLRQSLAVEQATDSEVLAFLQRGLSELGEQFELGQLRVEGGACYCKGKFWIAAS
ncbi:MAG: DUF2993 domain-containing protein [Pseudanabaenaceae cyanobacterium bins.68]|nr:DUF2993 domain-containing protein [Pseudanabaenaceae cyanobacterium bins.68]